MQHRQELQGAEAGAALPHPDELPGRLLHRRAQPPDAAGPQLPSRHHSPQAAAAAAYFAVHQDPRQGEPAAGASSSAGGHVAIRQDLRRAGTTADSGLAGVRVGLDVACFGDAPQDPRRGAATSGFSYDSGTIRVAKDAPYHAVAFAVRRGLQGGGRQPPHAARLQLPRLHDPPEDAASAASIIGQREPFQGEPTAGPGSAGARALFAATQHHAAAVAIA